MRAFRFDFDAQDSHAPILAEKTDASSKDVEAVFVSFDRQASSLHTNIAVDYSLQLYKTHRVNLEDPLPAVAGPVTEHSGRDTVTEQNRRDPDNAGFQHLQGMSNSAY